MPQLDRDQQRLKVLGKTLYGTEPMLAVAATADVSSLAGAEVFRC